MGMYVGLAAVSDATIERLHADPPLIWQLIAPDDPEAVAATRGPARRRGGARGRPGVHPCAASARPAADEGDLGAAGDLDKAWHGLHYLLTGTAWEGEPPLNFLLAGGREVDEVEVPAHTFTAAETRAIAAALARVSDNELGAASLRPR